MVRYQVGALKGFLDAEGVELHHVKPHGVLYGMHVLFLFSLFLPLLPSRSNLERKEKKTNLCWNTGMMYRDPVVCRAVYEGVPKGTPVLGLAGTCHETIAHELGLPFIAELYGDVKYNKDRTLVIDRVKK